jgi:hypothetical protein
MQTADFCCGDLDGPAADPHGTAVAKVIHEMAPGADLLLACIDRSPRWQRQRARRNSKAPGALYDIDAVDNALAAASIWPGANANTPDLLDSSLRTEVRRADEEDDVTYKSKCVGQH